MTDVTKKVTFQILKDLSSSSPILVTSLCESNRRGQVLYYILKLHSFALFTTFGRRAIDIRIRGRKVFRIPSNCLHIDKLVACSRWPGWLEELACRQQKNNNIFRSRIFQKFVERVDVTSFIVMLDI